MIEEVTLNPRFVVSPEVYPLFTSRIGPEPWVKVPSGQEFKPRGLNSRKERKLRILKSMDEAT